MVASGAIMSRNGLISEANLGNATRFSFGTARKTELLKRKLVMPARRRSTRIASSPETSVFDVTGTSTPALVDSATPGKSSPGTTPSLDNVRPKRQPRGRVAALRGKKRAVMSDEEMELGQEDKASARRGLISILLYMRACLI